MSFHSPQAATALVIVRPRRVYPNPETVIDNVFQRTPKLNDGVEMDSIAKSAYIEVTEAVEALQRAGVRTHVFDDEGNTPHSTLFSQETGFQRIRAAVSLSIR